ncbi:hypothetical protein HK102_002006 [Quaeritorhiza haematococci]|nr:hypothetical protein HK102_002006 [Quaeritorhiza haematococci]
MTIPEFDVDEFVTCARYGELEEMQAMVSNYLLTITGASDPTEALASPSTSATLRDLFMRKNSTGGNTALHYASANGELEVMKYLLPHLTPGDINSGNDADNSTPLHWASLNGKKEAVEVLIKCGADATVKNGMGRSSVTVAEQQGHLEVVQVLLKSFDEVDEDDEEEVDEGASKANIDVQVETEVVSS